MPEINFTTQEFIQVWLDGGLVMIPLVLVSFFIYFTGMQIFLHLGGARLNQVPNSVLLQWVREPQKGRGFGGEVIRYALAGGWNLNSIRGRIEEIRLKTIPPVNAKSTMLSNLVATAPLMGLLGTVIGMLRTFQALAISTGQTIDLVAGGIKEALVTTQTGLMVAIPGYVLIALVVRRRNSFTTSITRIENLLHQEYQRRVDQEAA